MIKMHVKLHEILKFENATNPFGNHSYHTAFLNTKHLKFHSNDSHYHIPWPNHACMCKYLLKLK